jgi:hypothetical protein
MTAADFSTPVIVRKVCKAGLSESNGKTTFGSWVFTVSFKRNSVHSSYRLRKKRKMYGEPIHTCMYGHRMCDFQIEIVCVAECELHERRPSLASHKVTRHRLSAYADREPGLLSPRHLTLHTTV